jgi:ketosteroid isomerase-like protein
MHPHARLIEQFYTSFGKRDAEAMVACYHADIVFSDEVFPRLEGSRAAEMWRMLLARSIDLAIDFSGVAADVASGRAHWDARYTFTKTGRHVLNQVDATFEFRDDKIVRHVDRFDFWRWSRQALGVPGVVLGWTPLLRTAVRRQAAEQLDAWLARRRSARTR